ncbi:MAG: 4-hydroxy-3-methylbut-2-en-1-yl diphosphate synthase [bacterium P3]|nr:MAG: 4-hydroxy-3-methylbut-2-en-1-yl diphosphate synthase [bacterium P3]KWW42207.1 MAG: 4-hydroxy-3-methylbut-2-en-1-yl diphosphate synthase [bacterium F083]
MSRQIKIGNLTLGGGAPIRVQSMTNTDTMDTRATVEQTLRMVAAGCELVRITAPDVKAAENLGRIKEELLKHGCAVPLVADIHFNPKAAEVAAALVEKVRVNPGNYTDRNTGKLEFTEQEYNDELKRIGERMSSLIDICKAHHTAMRIGTNHGSLSERVMSRYGNTPEGMAQSAMEFARVCREQDYHNLVFSMKASNVKVMVQSTRRFVEMMQAEGMDYPIHLGVTEAGDGDQGRLKSAAGIGALLIDGIGDTLRVSLTEDPVAEIPVAYDILQAVGARISKAEYIACPSCGRTQYNIQEALHQIKARTSHLKGLKIGVMGCIVNGPGEMADADYGYVGSGEGKITLYKGQQVMKRNIDQADAVDELVALIKAHGDWQEA